MSKGLTITIPDLSKALNDVNKFKGRKLDDISKEVKGLIQDIVADAQVKAPNDMGHLRQSIRVTEVRRFDAEAEVQAGYSAYVEFGTGTLVNVPKGLEAYAMQFKGKGIKQVNLPARPFFYPAVMKNAREFQDRLKTLLSRK